jgi:phosphoserine phosphatase
LTHVVTLIANPASPVLSARHVRRVADVLPIAAPHWLAPGLAVDLPFAPQAGADNRRLVEDLRTVLDGEPIDVVVQPAATRRKQLLVADMDSTLIEQECIDELAEAVGLRAHIAAITERSMRGDIAFEPALRERVALLRGLDFDMALRIFRERITLMPGGRTLVQTMRAHGATTVVASGGFTVFTALVAAALGCDEHFANTLCVSDGKLTGALAEPIFGRDSKRQILEHQRDARRLAGHDTMAVGDGANDLAMLAAAGLGVAFRAKPAVAVAAQARIDHGDLTALLYLQGYAQADFAAT